MYPIIIIIYNYGVQYTDLYAIIIYSIDLLYTCSKFRIIVDRELIIITLLSWDGSRWVCITSNSYPCSLTAGFWQVVGILGCQKSTELVEV